MQGTMKVSKYQAKILTIAWWGLKGIAICWQNHESQLSVGVGRKEIWSIHIALQVCQGCPLRLFTL